MKYIQRVDDQVKQCHGWRVQIRALRKGKLFSDARHGGRDGALKAAITWRNTALHAAGVPLSARQMVTVQSPRNSSGIIGIHIQRRGARRAYVVNFALEPGRSKRKAFPIPADDAGQRKALKEAVAFRRKQERTIYGATIAANWAGAMGIVCNE